jgi:hypothetical protein
MSNNPLQILDTKERVTGRKKLKMYKILWDHHTIDEATWEIEDYLQKKFPEFLKNPKVTIFQCIIPVISGRDSFLGGKVVTP